MKKRHKYIIGIDEAGRGPIAGPVTAAALLMPKNFKITHAKLPLRDSKKLSPKQRREWMGVFNDNSNIYYASASVSAAVINRDGIQQAVKMAVRRALNRVLKKTGNNSANTIVYLDGLLSAPRKYNQKTIKGGDGIIPAIMAASIVAKNIRDDKMIRMHKRFSQYSFDVHKGYGTKAHKKALKRYGLSVIHRIQYCRTFLNN